jgi:hypothetical protein
LRAHAIEVSLRSRPSGSPLADGNPGSESPSPIDPRHQEDLDTLRDLLRTAVELESPCDHAEPATGQQPSLQTFLAHFPELRPRLQEWDETVERARIAPGALWEWFAAAAAERGIAEPAFAVGSLIDHLAILTLQRARTWQLDAPYVLSVEQFRDRLGDDEYVSIHLKGQRVAKLPMRPHANAEQRVQAAGRLLQGLFDDAQASEEAHAVVEARDSLLVLKEQLLELLGPRPADTPTLSADGCPYCEEIASAGKGGA